MSITIEDRANPLLELLWIREAYHLRPDGDDLPPLLLNPPTQRLTPPSSIDGQSWTSAWPSLWAATVAHAGTELDPSLHERLSHTANGSRERLDLLQRIVGTNWRDHFGPAALDRDSYQEWNHAAFQAKLASRPAGLGGNALRRDLDAVVTAWRAGMNTIITIPCRDEYTRRVGDNALLITEQTITTSDSFRRALAAFA
jgi:hypothetical protein